MIRPFARHPCPASLRHTAAAVGVVALLSAMPAPARAQAAPSPAEFHGHELGTRYTLTSALYDYYRALAAASSPEVPLIWGGRRTTLILRD